MKLHRRSFIAAAGAVAIGLPAGRTGAAAPLRIGDQKGGIRALMTAAGALDGLAVPLQWSEFPAAAPLAEALNAGAIDAGTIGDAPFTFAAAAGVPIKGVVAFRERRAGLAIVVPGASEVRDITGLRGRRIGTGRGSIGHQLVLAQLERAGLAPGDVQLSFLTPADAQSAFTNGAIDAWSTWEPYTSQLELQQGARIVADGAGVTPGLGFIAASDAAIAERRDELAQFLGRVAQARAWAATHVDAYAQAWSRLVGLPPEIPTRWFTRAGFAAGPIDAAVVRDEQATIDLFTRHGLLLEQIQAADILDASFTETIVTALARAGGAP